MEFSIFMGLFRKKNVTSELVDFDSVRLRVRSYKRSE